ncbi:MAG: HD domain-containing protein [Frankiales bacterium]|nr:HD domain-containing protein [Frankiales bacterium]
MRDLPVPARLYLILVVAVGAGLVVFSSLRLSREEWLAVLPLAALVILAKWFASDLRAHVNISVGMPIAIASVILLGAEGATLVMAAVVFAPAAARFSTRLFNAAMFAITATVSGLVYEHLGTTLLGPPASLTVWQVVVPSLVAAAVLEVTNGLLLVAMIALSEHVSPLRVWYGTLAESALPMFIYSIFGLMLAVVWSYAGPISALLVLAPLMVARWVFAEFAARQEAYEATMRSLIKSVETKDLYTRGHSERVSRASVLIGRRAGMREDRVASLRYAGMLHDVGKLGVPTTVLQKAGRLTEEEYEAIQQHTVRGREITKDLEFLGEAIEGIHLHHERIDGRGYPLGLKGAEIPEFARIIAVADAFDSMTTTRSYRGARSIEDAVVELRNCKGSQFDPVMVEALVEAVDAEGWDVADTLPAVPPVPIDALPSFASDDDDPTAAGQLGLPSAAPDDASELVDDASVGGPGEDAS